MSICPTLRHADPQVPMTLRTETLGVVLGLVHPADDGTVGHAELTVGD